ncbi:MAG: dATP/dGTP diphosphohydrolase domain-containing protein [Roseobacter sp.]
MSYAEYDTDRLRATEELVHCGNGHQPQGGRGAPFVVHPAPKSGAIPPPHPNDPKQGAGEKKVPFAALPFAVLCEDAVAHGEGALKYRRHNWRKGEVLSSTYYAAAIRHLFAFIEGEDIDPESGVHHLTKCRASLGVLRDAQIHGTAIDDRPNASPTNLMADLNAATVEMTRRVVLAGLVSKPNGD